MICPHCTTTFHDDWKEWEYGSDSVFSYWIRRTQCPSCRRVVLQLHTVDREPYGTGGLTVQVDGTDRYTFVVPRAPSRAPIHESVDSELAGDYREACLVLADSPKASAALSRRCLQNLLREKAGVKPANLDKEIDEAMTGLPAHLADAIDGVRVIGNFAAHPIKSQSTGEVVDVEPGEAEWNLDTPEGLFDHYFTQPALLAAKREALNKKLQDAGKPQLKSAGGATP